MLWKDDSALAELDAYFVSIVRTEHKDGVYFSAQLCETQGL